MKIQRQASQTRKLVMWEVNSQKPQNALRSGMNKTYFGANVSYMIKLCELIADVVKNINNVHSKLYN